MTRTQSTLSFHRMSPCNPRMGRTDISLNVKWKTQLSSSVCLAPLQTSNDSCHSFSAPPLGGNHSSPPAPLLFLCICLPLYIYHALSKWDICPWERIRDDSGFSKASGRGHFSSFIIFSIKNSGYLIKCSPISEQTPQPLRGHWEHPCVLGLFTTMSQFLLMSPLASLRTPELEGQSPQEK